VNFASYWGFTVSENSLNIEEAWKFIDFLAQPENVKKYAEKTRLPVARRDLILWQQQDEQLRHFTNQILSARSWYHGDYAAVEKILQDMIDSAQRGDQTIEEALADAAARITVVIQKIRE
jgi:ABC-type glycerol-3-phosphate transport system substrate-binding protein